MDVPYYLLLSRASSLAAASVDVIFHLIDADGHSTGRPDHDVQPAEIPKGKRFHQIVGTVALRFPRPGVYRLDLTAAADGLVDKFYYDLEARPAP